MMFGIDLNVEYIVADGRQMIETDWIPLLNTKVSLTFMFHFDPTDKTPYAITVFNTLDKDTGVMFSVLKGGDAEGRFYHLEAYNNYTYPTDYPMWDGTVDNGKLYEFTLDSHKLFINGGLKGQNNRYVSNKSPMTILEATKGKTTLDLYGCKCWNNGILEREFVPAKKNGVYGLYDKVNRKFWRSSTGVDFSGGVRFKFLIASLFESSMTERRAA